MSGSPIKNVLRARPRLLYAGINNSGVGWLNLKKPTECAELVYICSGSGKSEIGDDTYPFATGDLLVFNSGAEHREYFDETPERELLFVGLGNLHINGYNPGALLSGRDFCIVHTDVYGKTLSDYIHALISETEGTQPLHEAIAENLLKAILLTTVRLVSFDTDLTIGEQNSYLEAKRYFDEHFLEIDSIQNVCKSLYINKYYLSHLFAQNAGMPPVKYLINKKIELACNYLEHSDDNVADIGKLCGYSDPCYFSRTFKKVKGVTPLRYRYLFKLDKEKKG